MATRRNNVTTTLTDDELTALVQLGRLGETRSTTLRRLVQEAWVESGIVVESTEDETESHVKARILALLPANGARIMAAFGPELKETVGETVYAMWQETGELKRDLSGVYSLA